MDNEIYLGAIDTQTPEQKAKNYDFAEVCTASFPATWVEKPQENWNSYPIRDQDGSGTCVCQTYANELGIIFKQKYGIWKDFSSAYPYQARKYPSQSGCTSEDIYSIFPKIGNVYESYMPSQLMSDSQVMAVKKESYYDDLAKLYTISRIQLPLDFETVASTVQATGKGVMIWVKFSVPEWTDIPQILPQPITSGHSITVVDFVLKGGKKYLVIQDSWGLKYAMKGLRLISEEYFAARCFVASYLMNFTQQNNITVAERPHFAVNSVASAKDCLKWEGLFPGNLPSNDVADNIFRTALISYQKRFNIQPTLGNFGPLTNASLLANYK